MTEQIVAREPWQCRADIHARSLFGEEYEVGRGERGAIIGALNKVLGGDQNRHILLGWLFNEGFAPMASGDLNNMQWSAMREFVGFWQDDSGEWHTRPTFATECAMMLSEAFRTRSNIPRSMQQGELEIDTLQADAAANLGGIITAIRNEADGELEEREVAINVRKSKIIPDDEDDFRL